MPTKKQRNTIASTWIFITVLIIDISLFSNSTGGWASLIVIMKEEGIFSNLCQEINTTTQSNGQTMRVCSQQDERFNMILTIAWAVSMTCSVLIGFLVDRFNVKIVRTLGSFGYGLGMVLLAFSSHAHPYVMLPGTTLVHLGGLTLFICSCRAVSAFGKWRSLILSVLNGALITSGVLFSILKTLYDSGIGKEYLFISVGCVSIVTLALLLVFHPPVEQSSNQQTPDKFYKIPEIDYTKKSEECSVLKTVNRTKLFKIKQSVSCKSLGQKAICNEEDGKCKRSTLLKLIVSAGFIWGILFIGLCRFRFLLFLTTFLQFIEQQPGADAATAKAYSVTFGLIPGSSVLLGPLLGMIITAGKNGNLKPKLSSVNFSSMINISKLVRPITDCCTNSRIKRERLSNDSGQKKKHSSCALLASSEVDQDENASTELNEVRGCLLSFSATGCLLLAFGVFVLVPNVYVQVLSMALVTLMRVFCNGGISNMLLVMFPHEYFGVLFAINCIATAAICSLEFPFSLAMEICFHGDMFWPNVILLIISFAAFGLPVFLCRHMKQIQEKMLVQSITSDLIPVCKNERKTDTLVYNEVYHWITAV